MSTFGLDTTRCWVEINLAALERNLHAIRSALPAHISYVAVIKADAYGHGMPQVATRLMQSGTDLFAVANLQEASVIREMGTGWPVLILSAILPSETPMLFDGKFIPTVSGIEEIERFDKAAAQRNTSLPVHLKVDTGMGRIGIWHEEIDKIIPHLQSAKNLKLEGVFTHFSSANNDAGFTRLQRERFLTAVEKIAPHYDLEQLLIHADNSAALSTFDESGPINAVRVGLLQFGVSPYPDSLFGKVETEPVLSFHCRVGLVKHLPKGTPISYSRLTTLERDSRIAILSAGYADGIPLALTNKAEVLIHGKRCRTLGRITMDQVIVDITDLDETVTPGEVVTLIGNQQDACIRVEEYANWAGINAYNCFTSISKRVKRVYTTARQ